MTCECLEEILKNVILWTFGWGCIIALVFVVCVVILYHPDKKKGKP